MLRLTSSTRFSAFKQILKVDYSKCINPENTKLRRGRYLFNLRNTKICCRFFSSKTAKYALKNSLKYYEEEVTVIAKNWRKVHKAATLMPQSPWDGTRVVATRPKRVKFMNFGPAFDFSRRIWPRWVHGLNFGF